MSLSPEQQNELKKLAQELNKIEQFAVENKIDLDHFVSEFSENGPVGVASERVMLTEKGSSRKKAFGQEPGEQQRAATVKSK